MRHSAIPVGGQLTRRNVYGLGIPVPTQIAGLARVHSPACIPLSAVPADWEAQVIPSACDESKAVAIC